MFHKVTHGINLSYLPEKANVLASLYVPLKAMNLSCSVVFSIVTSDNFTKLSFNSAW